MSPEPQAPTHEGHHAHHAHSHGHDAGHGTFRSYMIGFIASLILTAIPFKGEVLTQTARYWFEETADICPNHVRSYPDPNVVIGTRLDILPVEIVVRGYLAGTTSTSILTKYRKGERQMYGITLPDGLRDNEKLPEPIITPVRLRASSVGGTQPESATASCAAAIA